MRTGMDIEGVLSCGARWEGVLTGRSLAVPFTEKERDLA